MRRILSPRLKTIDKRTSESHPNTTTNESQIIEPNDESNNETAGLLIDFNDDDDDLIQF